SAHGRMAIGQVLDYTHLAKKHGIDAAPVILLPGRPEPDLQDLISSLNITTVIRTDTGFDITSPSSAALGRSGPVRCRRPGPSPPASHLIAKGQPAAPGRGID